MIRHTVTFKLKHESGSIEEKSFLDEALELADLPTVQKFECLKQIGSKNNFDFGLSMEFENRQDYQSYSNHPDHISFVNNTWIPQVIDFIELDYQL
ncbi:MAG: Dabb family protein [Lentisphaeraceae bacterium]|nr:Dabb family protein [Lentisphaeraceae bacterium]